MEKIYYPSVRKIFLYKYLYPIIGLGLGILISVFIGFFRNGVFEFSSSGFWVGLLLGIFGQGLIDGFKGERLAIKITPASIYGPIAIGRDMPIPFNEIDFDKSRKTKTICSINGDIYKFQENLFEPEDVKEIWETIKKHESK